MTVALYVVICAAALTFAVACGARIVTYARLPVHLRWELYPIPHENAAGAGRLARELRFMVPEILFLRALRDFNRPLWFRSFPFHFGLYLLALAGGLLLLTALATVVGGGVPAGALFDAVRWIYTASGSAGLILAIGGALALFQRRMSDPSLRPYTTPGDLGNLLFFAAAFGVVGVGYLMRPPGSPGALSLAVGLLSWNTALRIPIALAAGLAAVAALVAYIPLTHMSHFIGKYFTYHAVRWDDRSLHGSRRLATAVAAHLSRRPTWSAGHIMADGNATWADVAASRPSGDARR